MTEPDAINARLDAVALLVEDARRRAGLREALAKPRPIFRARWRGSRSAAADRAISRAVRDALGSAENYRRCARGRGEAAAGTGLPRCKALAAPGGNLAGELAAALADDLPLLKRDGGFVRAGL